MSGGSYGYVFQKIEDAAEDLRHTHSDARRAAFKQLLLLVSQAMHDIEWVDSCDYGSGGDHKSIDEVFSFLSANPDVIKKAAAYDELEKMLAAYFRK